MSAPFRRLMLASLRRLNKVVSTVFVFLSEFVTRLIRFFFFFPPCLGRRGSLTARLTPAARFGAPPPLFGLSVYATQQNMAAFVGQLVIARCEP